MFDYDVAKDIVIAQRILNLNDSTFAQLLGVPRSTINNWKTNKTHISNANQEKLYSFIYSNKVFLNKLYEQSLIDTKNKDTAILFHGAKTDITSEISLDKSNTRNDFGKGFYLGENLLQSASFVCNYPSSSIYIGKLNHLSELRTIEYAVDNDWMITIAHFREKLKDFDKSEYVKSLISRLDGIDVVIAPIADNRMFRILDEFIEGNITDLQCKSALSATDLGKQFVLISKKAVEHLDIIHHSYLCSAEKNNYLENRESITEISSQKVKYVKREFAGKGNYIEDVLA